MNGWLDWLWTLLAEYVNTGGEEEVAKPALGQVSHSIGLNWKLGPTVTAVSNQLELIISSLGSRRDLTGSLRI